MLTKKDLIRKFHNQDTKIFKKLATPYPNHIKTLHFPESSASFHENELVQPPVSAVPQTQPQAHFRGGHQGSSSSSSSVPAMASTAATHAASAAAVQPTSQASWMNYANR